nr:DMT family transporter [Sporomusa silvacetica]
MRYRRKRVYIILAAVIFSTMEIASKTVAADINPFQLNFIRFLIGGVILLPTSMQVINRKNIELNRNDCIYFIATGFLGIVISMSFFQFAILYTMASTVAIIFSANPTFTTPIAYFLLNEKINKKVMLSLAVSLLGVFFILNPFGIHTDMKGIILAILAAITFAVYSVVSKMRVERYGCVVSTCFSFLAGDIILLVLMLISHLPLFATYQQGNITPLLVDIPIISGINYSNIAVLIYLGVVVSGLGFLFYFMAMEKSSASVASIVFFIKPALAPLFCLLILRKLLLRTLL